MDEQKAALEDFAKQKEIIYRQSERSIQMKQQTLWTQLQKEMSVEQEAQMQVRKPRSRERSEPCDKRSMACARQCKNKKKSRKKANH